MKKSFRGICLMSLVILFFAFTALIALSGCRRTDNQIGNKKAVKLTFCAEADATYISLYNKVISNFVREHPEIEIVPIYVQSDYYSKLLTMFASNTASDVFWMGQGFGDFAQRGCLLNLDNYVTPEPLKEIASFSPEVLNLYKHQGKLMGLPTGINVALIFYNVTLFDQAGIKYPDESWSLDDFIAAAKKLTKDTNNDGKIDQYGALVSRPGLVLNSFGANLLSKDGTKCELTSKGAIEALTFVRDLTTKYKVSPKETGGSVEGFAGQEPFLTGRLGMIIGLDVNLENLRKSIKSFKWDIAPIPCKNKKRYWASSSGFCVSANSKSKKEAVVFLQYLASDPDAQRILAPLAIPVIKDVAVKVISETSVPKHASYLLDMIKYINPTPRIAGITQIESITKGWEEKAIMGMISPETAYKEASKEIMPSLQNIR